MKRKCSELKKDDQVVFRLFNGIYQKEIPNYGNVICVDLDRRKVAVCYLEGYRSEFADVPFEKMLGVYDPKGEYLDFDGYVSGRSALLIPE